MDDIDALVEWQLADKPTDFHVCPQCCTHWSGDGAFCPGCDLAQ